MIKYLQDNAKNIGIRQIMKKNQVVILALALMLMTAGYLNYTNNHENENLLLAGLGDAQLVSANAIDSNNIIENLQTESMPIVANQENTNQVTQETSTNATNDDYFTRSKLERETMYSQMLETYTGILENEKISSEQKYNIADNTATTINHIINLIILLFLSFFDFI